MKERLERKGNQSALEIPYGPVETEEISQLLRDKKQAEQAQMRILLIE